MRWNQTIVSGLRIGRDPRCFPYSQMLTDTLMAINDGRAWAFQRRLPDHVEQRYAGSSEAQTQ